MTNYILSKDTLKAYQSVRKKNKNKPVCLAPWKSLRFEPDGAVSVCCHNNSYMVGSYPEDRVHGIWNGTKIKKLRKKLKNGDFSSGCQVCYEDFKGHNFDAVNPLLYEKYKGLKKQPVVLDFKTETACNLRCIMCSEYSSSSIQAEKNIVNRPRIFGDGFIRELRPWIKRAREFRFSGGEPFMSPFYFQLWQTILDINPEVLITVQTNGAILTEKMKNLLNHGNFSINVSLDAMNKEVYEKIRIGAKLDDVKNNINYFSRYSLHNNIRFGITACIMKDNWQELPLILKYANKKGALMWYNPVHFPFVNALWLMPPDDLKHIHSELSKASFSDDSTWEKENKQIYEAMLRKIQSWADSSVYNSPKQWVSKEESISNLLDMLKTAGTPGSLSFSSRLEKKLLIVKNRLPDKKMLDLQVLLNKMHRKTVVFSVLHHMPENEILDNLMALQKRD
jgi:MoaA/NifB/PqqE/SkfB family radical SAM enzyme